MRLRLLRVDQGPGDQVVRGSEDLADDPVVMVDREPDISALAGVGQGKGGLTRLLVEDDDRGRHP